MCPSSPCCGSKALSSSVPPQRSPWRLDIMKSERELGPGGAANYTVWPPVYYHVLPPSREMTIFRRTSSLHQENWDVVFQLQFCKFDLAFNQLLFRNKYLFYLVTFHLLVLTVLESPVGSSMFPPHELTHGRLHRKQIFALGSESVVQHKEEKQWSSESSKFWSGARKQTA